MLLYENKYFVEKIEIRKNMLKDLTVSLRVNKILFCKLHHVLNFFKRWYRAGETILQRRRNVSGAENYWSVVARFALFFNERPVKKMATFINHPYLLHNTY